MVKVYLTTSRNASKKTILLAKELSKRITNSHFKNRGARPLELIIEDARYNGSKFIAVLEDEKSAHFNIFKLNEKGWENLKKIPDELAILSSEIKKIQKEKAL